MAEVQEARPSKIKKKRCRKTIVLGLGSACKWGDPELKLLQVDYNPYDISPLPEVVQPYLPDVGEWNDEIEKMAKDHPDKRSVEYEQLSMLKSGRG